MKPNNNFIIKVCLLAVLMTIPSFLSFRALSQSDVNSNPMSREKEAGGGRNWEEVEVVFLKIRRRKQSGGSRSAVTRGRLCLVSPTVLVSGNSRINPEETTEGMIEIWNRQPRLIWQVDDDIPREVVISELNDREIWRQEITANQNSILYEGQPLQPGKSYRWSLKSAAALLRTTAPITFKVMAGEKRETITQALQQIEQSLSNESPEKIALAKANYLIDQNLWSDALQEIFAVENPSSALEKTLQKIQSHNFCQ